MSKTRKVPTQNTKTKATVDVMYQNLQGAWYAFADIDGEIYFARVPVKVALNKDNQKALKAIKEASQKQADS